MITRERIRELFVTGAAEFWTELSTLTESAANFEDLIFLSALRKKAVARGLQHPRRNGAGLRLAVLGGYSLYPLHELITHRLESRGIACELFVGDYDNYIAEISESESGLYAFKPDVVFLFPGPQRSRYPGSVTDARSEIESAGSAVVTQLLDLCRTVSERSGASVILGNFILPARRDPGPLRSRTLASDWNFRKWLNLELGLKAPPDVRLCDLEFLANRHGALAAEDPRGWFESKQPCSPAFLLEISREVCRIILSLRQATKKVLVLDLDNTLWGGVVADEGLDGIDLGDTSPRGEAFKAFQKHILSLKARGILLAVCSKNDRAVAMEPFEKHPDMVLRMPDFVAFAANWDPKSDNLRKIAADLNLGLDSFVFVDDNPAEIEIVRQFTPEVSTLLLGEDPSGYPGQLQDCGFFEVHAITGEDTRRTEQYRAEAQRRDVLASAADMGSYLQSLAMEAMVCRFNSVDVPRLAQLINKSNQFNLTTRRRSEAEVLALIDREDCVCYSVRLKDRFGDHGLISILIAHVAGEVMEIDTWIMSCRVLKRQVEELVLNEVARLAAEKGCIRLHGLYLPTPKNEMVRDFYPRMGFQPRQVNEERGEYFLELNSFQARPTSISIVQRSYESN